MTDLEALVVAAYVFADEYPVPARGGRRPLVSDAELVALAVCQAAIGISSDRQFLGLVGRVLPGWFPHLPEQSQYNRRLRGLVELISIVQQRLARWLDTRRRPARRRHPARGRQLRRLPAAKRVRRLRPLRLRDARSTASSGASGSCCLTDERGLPLGYTIVPANEHEYEPLADLLTGTPAEVVIADKGFWGRDYRERLAADGTSLLTPEQDPHRRQPRPRTRARLDPAGDRERLREPQRPDAARAPPRQNTRRTRRPNRAAHPRAHASESSSTPSPADPHAPSPPTTAAESHQASS